MAHSGDATATGVTERPPTAPTAAPSGPRRPDRAGTPRREDHRVLLAEELLDLEHARLTLRAEHGLAVDRGRIVREAIAVVLADLEAKGEQSILVRRLRGPLVARASSRCCLHYVNLRRCSGWSWASSPAGCARLSAQYL